MTVWISMVLACMKAVECFILYGISAVRTSVWWWLCRW